MLASGVVQLGLSCLSNIATGVQKQRRLVERFWLKYPIRGILNPHCALFVMRGSEVLLFRIRDKWQGFVNDGDVR